MFMYNYNKNTSVCGPTVYATACPYYYTCQPLCRKELKLGLSLANKVGAVCKDAQNFRRYFIRQ